MSPSQRINWEGLAANVVCGAAAAAAMAMQAPGATLRTILMAAGAGALTGLVGTLTNRTRTRKRKSVV
jgi:hypothetical protein